MNHLLMLINNEKNMDTIQIICDTVWTKIGEYAICQPLVAESKVIDCSNVIITLIVCGAVVAISIVACVQYFRWKTYVFDKKNERERQVEDAKREQIAEYRKQELEFIKDCYLRKEEERKFNTTNVDDDNLYILSLEKYIESIKKNNQD
jgi:hypothetical protein